MTERRQGGDRREGPRRREDKWKIHIRENWYRDVWLLIISGVVALALIKALNTADRAKTLVQDIQSQRVEAIRNNCRDQNTRHLNTLHELDVLDARLPPSRRAEARAGRPGVVLLINALAPYQDCKKVVALATRTTPKKKVLSHTKGGGKK